MSIQNGYYLTITSNGVYSISGDSCFIVSNSATAGAGAYIKNITLTSIEVVGFSSFGYIKLWVFYA